MTLIATEKASFLFVPNGAWLPETPTTATTQTIPVARLKASGNRVVSSAVFTPRACTLPGAVFVAGAGVIKGAAATAIKTDKQIPMTDRDEGSCTGAFTTTGGATIVCTCKIKVANPGQQKASTR